MGVNPCGRHVLKLVINTHVNYTTPLAALFASLYRIRFSRFADVLVVQAGHAAEAPPRLELVSTLAHEGDDRIDDGYVVAIRTRSNAIDYTGLAQLYRHRAHPLVRAEMYVHGPP